MAFSSSTSESLSRLVRRTETTLRNMFDALNDNELGFYMTSHFLSGPEKEMFLSGSHAWDINLLCKLLLRTDLSKKLARNEHEAVTNIQTTRHELCHSSMYTVKERERRAIRYLDEALDVLIRYNGDDEEAQSNSGSMWKYMLVGGGLVAVALTLAQDASKQEKASKKKSSYI